MPVRIVPVGAGEWGVEKAEGDPNMLLRATLMHEPTQDAADGIGMSLSIQVKNHLDTAMQLNLIEAMIQQLNEVRTGLAGEVMKGNRS